MAFKFMKKVRYPLNARRNARKQMHKPSFEKKSSLSNYDQPVLSEEKNDQNLTKVADSQATASDLADELKTNEKKQSANKQSDVSLTNETPSEPTSSLKTEKDDDRQNDTTLFTKPATTKKSVKKASIHPDSTIIVIYQDENHQSLSSPQIISGHRGETINFDFKEFNHYDLINIAGYTSIFVEPYGSVTLTYRRQSGANIWLFSQDIDDLHMLGKPRFVSGKVDEKYSLTPPDFIGYNLLRAKGPVKGNFNKKQQVVTYYYRDATWKEVDFDIKYLKMKVSQPGYDAPRGNDTYITLAEGTVWQVFETVHLTNGERWHCLGGNLWVKEDYDQVQFVDSLPQYQISDHEKGFSIDLNFQAIIDFVPHRKLTLYDRPFGNPISTIEDGSIVTITERQGGREMQWFKIDDRGWTISQYLDFDIEHKVSQERKN